MDRIQQNRIREEICQCLKKISSLPALSSDQIPQTMKEYWGIDIEEVTDPKILSKLMVLEKKMDEQIKGFMEECPEERMFCGYGRPSEEKIKSILLRR